MYSKYLSTWLLGITLFVGYKTSSQPLSFKNDIDSSQKRNFHTAFKNPLEQATCNFESNSNATNKKWWLRKLFYEHLVEVTHPDYTFNFDFLPDWQIGHEFDEVIKTTWLNTRAFQIDGSLGKKLKFYSFFSENQGIYPNYLQQYIANNQIVPGQGQAHPSTQTSVGANVADFANSEAYICYAVNRYIDAELGYGRNFIGDGYRSLLLSNGTLSYPYLKIEAHAGRLHYTAMWAQMIDQLPIATLDTAYGRKNAVFHYLDWRVTPSFKIGFFENVIYRNVNVDKSYRGFDWAYANPLVFLRPVEYALGSDDKMSLGLNSSYGFKHITFYGQFLLNEFNAKDFLSNNGSYRNKYAYQIGGKCINWLGIKNLTFLLEFNTATPFTYSARIPTLNYAHYNQPLAHPLGGNFREIVNRINYQWKRWETNIELLYAYYGLDKNGFNYGHDIYKPYTTAVQLYGNYIGQGLSTTLYYGDIKSAYLINPKTNLRLELNITYRDETNTEFKHRDFFFSIGLRSSFRTFYYDF